MLKAEQIWTTGENPIHNSTDADIIIGLRRIVTNALMGVTPNMAIAIGQSKKDSYSHKQMQ